MSFGPLPDPDAVASVARSERPGSEVAVRATVFVFPDLDTGDTTYQAAVAGVRRRDRVPPPPG